MKRINFKAINVEASIDVFEERDLSKEIGNLLHQKAPNIGMDELARRIYHSEGDMDMEDADFAEMMSLLDGLIVFRAKQAIAAAAKDFQPKTEEV